MKEKRSFKGIAGNGATYYTNEDGEMHKEDGPAIIGVDGVESYYLHDHWYPTKEEWMVALRKILN
jgi:hypothetical protein